MDSTKWREIASPEFIRQLQEAYDREPTPFEQGKVVDMEGKEVTYSREEFAEILADDPVRAAAIKELGMVKGRD